MHVCSKSATYLPAGGTRTAAVPAVVWKRHGCVPTQKKHTFTTIHIRKWARQRFHMHGQTASRRLRQSCYYHGVLNLVDTVHSLWSCTFASHWHEAVAGRLIMCACACFTLTCRKKKFTFRKLLGWLWQIISNYVLLRHQGRQDSQRLQHIHRRLPANHSCCRYCLLQQYKTLRSSHPAHDLSMSWWFMGQPGCSTWLIGAALQRYLPFYHEGTVCYLAARSFWISWLSTAKLSPCKYR